MQTKSHEIKYYSIYLTRNKEIMYNTTQKRYFWNPSLTLNNSDVYKVTVSTTTFEEGPPVSTRIYFISPGKLSFVLNLQCLFYCRVIALQFFKLCVKFTK